MDRQIWCEFSGINHRNRFTDFTTLKINPIGHGWIAMKVIFLLLHFACACVFVHHTEYLSQGTQGQLEEKKSNTEKIPLSCDTISSKEFNQSERNNSINFRFAAFHAIQRICRVLWSVGMCVQCNECVTKFRCIQMRNCVQREFKANRNSSILHVWNITTLFTRCEPFLLLPSSTPPYHIVFWLNEGLLNAVGMMWYRCCCCCCSQIAATAVNL